MEEKQLTFEMDDSHRVRMNKILEDYKTIYPTDQIIRYSKDKRNELLGYIEEHKSNPIIASFKPTDLIDLPNIATRIMEYFGYRTVVLETPYGSHSSKNRTVLVISLWDNRFLITLQDADQEYERWKVWDKSADKSQSQYNILNAFPSRTQFMAIYCYHIENILKDPNGRNQQSFSCVTGYIFRQLAALYLYKKYSNKAAIDWALKTPLERSNIWQNHLNFFQVGLSSNIASCGANGFLIGGLRFAMPGYVEDNITDTTINNLAAKNNIEKDNAKRLINMLSGENIECLKKILCLIGKVMLGDPFVHKLCPKESHLTIIQYHKPNLIATCLGIIFGQLRTVLLNNSDDLVERYNSNHLLSEIEKQITNCLSINADGIFDMNYKDIITNHIFNQINGIQVYIITDPDRPIRNIDFYKELFAGKTVTYEGAYKKCMELSIKEETKEGKQISKKHQFNYAIPGGLNYTCNAQTIFITTEASGRASKLSDAKETNINYIDIDWDLAPLEDFIRKQSITPIVAGKLAMMSMVYMMNKLCLGIDAFDMIEQSTSSHYQEEKTESEYISEFYADCIEDFTGGLDPAKTIKDTESILKEGNKSYDEVDWGNTDTVATKVQKQEELRGLPTVTASSLLATYQTWKATKNISSSDPTLTDLRIELLNNLIIIKNSELVNYKKIFLCRKTKNQYTQDRQDISKQVYGMLGIQINDTWYKIKTDKMKLQKAKQKENYEKVFSRLEAQLDDAMKEIQSLKIH